MNIFVLHSNPTLAAHSQCDKHVVRMLVESCQLLASAYWVELGVRSRKAIQANPNAAAVVNELFDGFPRRLEAAKYDGTSLEGLHRDPYWATHTNHPCSIWARESYENFSWLVEHALGLAEAYTLRYGKTHASEAVVYWYKENPPKSFYKSFDVQRRFADKVAGMGLEYQPVFAACGLTPFPQSIPMEYRGDDAVQAHRLSYMETKAGFAEWRYTDAPYWWNPTADASI